MALGMETALTPREASFVADISYVQVTKAFEKRQVANVAGQPRKRTLDLRGTFKLAVAERLKLYPAPLKKRIQGKIAEAIKEARALAEVQDVNYTDQLVVTTFKTSELAKLVEERLGKIERMRTLIVEDANVQAGAPVFNGTRVMVRHIAGLVRNRVDRQEIIEDFPEVTDEMVELAVLYDRLYPQRGRPVGQGRSA
ncbi:DUF433 domain-containing protein [Azospirillum rugosum]|uniref:DUF433 domain-containing protein n=1 Tax=Azospirillum rugosum TaxID=416170 RepID=UPI00361C7189